MKELSVKTVLRILEHNEFAMDTRFVLLFCAAHSLLHDEWPDARTIAKHLHLSVSGVKEILADVENVQVMALLTPPKAGATPPSSPVQPLLGVNPVFALVKTFREQHKRLFGKKCPATQHDYPTMRQLCKKYGVATVQEQIGPFLTRRKACGDPVAPIQQFRNYTTTKGITT